MPYHPLHKPSALLTASGLVKTSDGRILAVLVDAGTAAAVLTLQDATAGGGTDIQKISAPIGGATFIDYGNLGGIAVATGIYATLTNAELLTNPGFETAGAGDPDFFNTWEETAGNGTIADETTLFHGGAHAAKLTAGAGVNTCITNTVTVAKNRLYQLSFWTRNGADDHAGQYGVYDVTGSADIVAKAVTGAASATYAQRSFSFTTPAACVSVRIDLWCPATNTDIAYFDDVSLKSGHAVIWFE